MSTSPTFSSHPITTILGGSLLLVSACHYACDETRNGERCIVSERGLEWEVHDLSRVVVNRDDRSALVVVNGAMRSDGEDLVEISGCEFGRVFVKFTMELGEWDTEQFDEELSSHRHSLYSPYDLVVDDAGIPAGTFGSVRKVTCRPEQHGIDEDRGHECSSFSSTDGIGTIVEATDSEATVELDFVAGRSRLILPVCSYSPSEEGWTE